MPIDTVNNIYFYTGDRNIREGVSLDWFPATSLMAGLLEYSLLCSVCYHKPSVHFVLQELCEPAMLKLRPEK